jgi:hypothetical protein
VEASVESGDDPEDDFHTTEIMHQQEIVGNDSADPMVEWSDARVKSKLDCAHKFNKSMLLDLLAVEMSKRIGLKETS